MVWLATMSQGRASTFGLLSKVSCEFLTESSLLSAGCSRWYVLFQAFPESHEHFFFRGHGNYGVHGKRKQLHSAVKTLRLVEIVNENEPPMVVLCMYSSSLRLPCFSIIQERRPSVECRQKKLVVLRDCACLDAVFLFCLLMLPSVQAKGFASTVSCSHDVVKYIDIVSYFCFMLVFKPFELLFSFLINNDLPLPVTIYP
ncbi:hypothetical protein DVH24_031572 [Malus domestica]|uniref:Uncharacterized protein n=1 Tax=Malus domestica TaxID=3750 RepID=A0A498J3I0_MALDO|nr:hypothetical protein DVH24_031572 [Malus domestica]